MTRMQIKNARKKEPKTKVMMQTRWCLVSYSLHVATWSQAVGNQFHKGEKQWRETDQGHFDIWERKEIHVFGSMVVLTAI